MVPNADQMIARLHTAMDLWATGVAIQRQSIRRRNPEASDVQIEALLGRWLQDRPGAEMGDGPRPLDR
jgi:hypothetical protein